MPAVARFAWTVLAYNVLVIGWGAYVRATGSGAGCGNHWPLCNGEVLPRSPGLATVIEFSHRLTSGLALLGVAALLVWTFRAAGRGAPARSAAVCSLVFILLEAAVGAGLVLFELVADNATMARAMFMVVHLLNTFLLLGSLSLTAWWLSGGGAPRIEGQRRALAGVAIGCAALLLAGASGAVAALGDTLFPSTSLRDAFAADLSPTSHLLIRLRMLHPVLAVGAAAAVTIVSITLSKGRAHLPPLLRAALTVLAAVQIGLGFANVLLLAPVWLQLLHLLVADMIWIVFVVLAAEALAAPAPAVAARAA